MLHMHVQLTGIHHMPGYNVPEAQAAHVSVIESTKSVTFATNHIAWLNLPRYS